MSSAKEQKRGLADMILEMWDKQRDLERRLAAAEASAKDWEETAGRHARNADFWHGQLQILETKFTAAQ